MSDSRAKFLDLLHDFDSAMLVTQTAAHGLRARPMAVAESQEDGSLWFVTDRKSGKIDDIHSHPEVNVTMQGGGKFLSLCGLARVVNDRSKVDELWNPEFKAWFPEGKDDPNLVLINVDGLEGEYWDNAGINGVKYLLQAGKAYLTGRRVEGLGREIHDKVELS